MQRGDVFYLFGRKYAVTGETSYAYRVFNYGSGCHEWMSREELNDVVVTNNEVEDDGYTQAEVDEIIEGRIYGYR